MIKFFRADKNDVAQLKKLWLESFDDTEEATDLFFDKNWRWMRAFCAKDKNKVVSALYLIETALNGCKAHYLCGASTKSDYRKRGIMAGLIDFALEAAKHDGDKFSVLMPANLSLYDYYAGFGYMAQCFAEKRIFSRDELFAVCDCSSEYNYNFEQLQAVSFNKNFLYGIMSTENLPATITGCTVQLLFLQMTVLHFLKRKTAVPRCFMQ